MNIPTEQSSAQLSTKLHPVEALYRQHRFSIRESSALMNEIISGARSNEEISAMLSLMHFRGETGEELAGFAQSVLAALPDRGQAERLPGLLDVCGTGGDGADTFNISTATAILLATLGAKVAKHGNRSVSSRCGSADVLEELGVSIELSHQQSLVQLQEQNFSFFYAPKYHTAFAKVAEVRKRLQVRTIFHLLGPLVNPLQPDFQVIGVFSRKVIQPVIEALALLGRKRALVVASDDGLDEFSISAGSRYALLQEEQISYHSIEPEEAGLTRYPLSNLRGGDPQFNGKILTDLFAGKTGGPAEAVILNAAAGLVAAGLVEDFKEGVEKARITLASGRALQKLQSLKGVSQ